MYAWQATVQDEAGKRIPLPVVTVYLNNGTTLASIFNEAGAPLPNPLTGTMEGFVQFWASAGQYKIRGAKSGNATEMWAVTIDAPAIRAEEAADRAEDEADRAQSYAGTVFLDVATLMADPSATYDKHPVGSNVSTRKEGAFYQVMPVGSTDYDIITTGLLRLKALPRNGVMRSDWVNMPADGATNAGPKIQRMIDVLAATGRGGIVEVYGGNGSILISSTVQGRDRIQVKGIGKPRILFGAGVDIFTISGRSYAGVTGFSVDGNGQTAGSFVRGVNTTGCVISHNELTNCPSSNNGSIVVFGTTGATRNMVFANSITGSLGNAIGIIGSGSSHNWVDQNSVHDCVGFGVFVAGRAFRNTITRNRTTSNGIELIGVTVGSNYNIIANNHAQGCRDNGISVTGDYCTVVGNQCYQNDLSGIFLYGSFNSCTGNTCMRNGQATTGAAGIAVHPVFGGTGQYNMISGNVCDDDQPTLTQQNSIRIMASSYVAWSPAQTVTIGTYRVNGIRIYRAATAGTTGATAPTHTSGSVSDGGVTWEYSNVFRSVSQIIGNVIGDNVYGRSIGESVFDQQVESTGVQPYRIKFLSSITAARRQTEASTTVTSADYIIGVRTTGAFTITLPAAPEVGRELVIADEYGAAATNNITINGNGNTINGAATLVLNVSHAVRNLYYTGTTWKAW